MPSLNFVWESYKGSQVLLSSDSNSTRDLKVKVMDISQNQLVLIVQGFEVLVLSEVLVSSWFWELPSSLNPS